MNPIGRSRNARLNQAKMHATEVLDNLAMLIGARSDVYIQAQDPWADARNALEQLVQCFHEANAYNNSMLKPRGPMAKTSDFDSENSGSSPDAATNERVRNVLRAARKNIDAVEQPYLAGEIEKILED